MRKETDYLVKTLKNVLDGEPWFGRPVFKILNEIHPALVHSKPNEDAHSVIELVYHMNTWAEFTLMRLEKSKQHDIDESDELDWRIIDPLQHTWTRALNELRTYHDRIIEILEQKDDAFLSEKVDFRNYDFRFLLNGLIQHDIYHLGQIAYVKKWFIAE